MTDKSEDRWRAEGCIRVYSIDLKRVVANMESSKTGSPLIAHYGKTGVEELCDMLERGEIQFKVRGGSLWLYVPEDVLCERIERRFEQMLREGDAP